MRHRRPYSCDDSVSREDSGVKQSAHHRRRRLHRLQLRTHDAGTHPDYRITVYDKLTYAGRRENLQDVAADYADRYQLRPGRHLRRASLWNRRSPSFDIDTIVNFAAETHVDRSILNPDAFIQTDVYGTYVLLEAARKAGNLRYHQISTDEVYGHIHGDHRSLETDCLGPAQPLRRQQSQRRSSGQRLPHHLRSAHHHQPRRQQHRPVPVSGKGRAALRHQCAQRHAAACLRRRPSSVATISIVGDHCEAIDLVLAQGVIGETYNIGTGTEMTNLEMVEILLDELGKPRIADPARGRSHGPRPALLPGRAQGHGAGLGAGLHVAKRPSAPPCAGTWTTSGGGNRSAPASFATTTNRVYGNRKVLE